MDYVFVKNGVIENIAVFDNPSEEMLQLFKNESGCDLLLLDENKKAILGGTWDGEDFIPPKPYPSWILSSEKHWIAPVEFPEDGEGAFYWDEESLSWRANISIELIEE